MNLRVAALAVLSAVLLAGCASGAGRSGRAVASIAPDGSIALQTRRHGLFGRAGETVVFRPGEPGYDAMKAQIEVLDTGSRRPVLTWTIGEPELTLPPGR